MSGLGDNPFFVLELPVTAGPREIEREAARLCGMLELGLAAAATYPTPLGRRTRTAEAVRAAAATLRDPRKRLVAELWAAGGAEAATGSPSGSASGSASGSGAGSGSETRAAASADAVTWREAFTATGWARR